MARLPVEEPSIAPEPFSAKTIEPECTDARPTTKFQEIRETEELTKHHQSHTGRENPDDGRLWDQQLLSAVEQREMGEEPKDQKRHASIC